MASGTAIFVDKAVAFPAPWFGIIPAIVAPATAWLARVEAIVAPILAYGPPFGLGYGGSGECSHAIIARAMLSIFPFTSAPMALRFNANRPTLKQSLCGGE
jgi:hypothetical protein